MKLLSILRHRSGCDLYEEHVFSDLYFIIYYFVLSKHQTWQHDKQGQASCLLPLFLPSFVTCYQHGGTYTGHLLPVIYSPLLWAHLTLYQKKLKWIDLGQKCSFIFENIKALNSFFTDSLTTWALICMSISTVQCSMTTVLLTGLTWCHLAGMA